MTVYGNYDVSAFKSCIQIFTVSFQMQNHLILNVLPLVSDDFAFGSRGYLTVYGNYNVIAFKSCIQIPIYSV